MGRGHQPLNLPERFKQWTLRQQKQISPDCQGTCKVSVTDMLTGVEA